MVEVDRVDALTGEGGSPEFGTLLDAAHTGTVHQLGAVTAQGEQGLPDGGAQPQPLDHRRGHFMDDIDDGLAGLGFLEVEGEVVPRATPFEQIGERRDVGRKVRPANRGDRSAPAEGTAHDPVVVEHRHPVGGQPDIALQPAGTELEGQAEGFEGVLGGVGAGTPMGEDDRFGEQRRGVLARTPRSWHGTNSGRVA